MCHYFTLFVRMRLKVLLFAFRRRHHPAPHVDWRCGLPHVDIVGVGVGDSRTCGDVLAYASMEIVQGVVKEGAVSKSLSGGGSQLQWGVADFADMNWHDCLIHGMSIGNDSLNLTFDIDYLLQWPTENERGQFLVVRCDLVFFDTRDLVIECANMYPSLEIGTIRMETPESEEEITDNEPERKKFFLECQEGMVSFTATGFKQTATGKPTWCATAYSLRKT